MAKQILWIHGWGVSNCVWDDVNAMLSEYDHHFVSFAECRTLEDLHSAVLEKLSPDNGQWVLIGWSMGAMLALELALDTDQRKRLSIEALVLISASLQFVDRDRSRGWPLRVVQRMSAQLSTDREETLSRFKDLMLSTSDKEKINMDDLENCLETGFTLEGLQSGLSYLIDSKLRGKWQQFIRQTDAPKWLWIHGGVDVVCPIGCLPDDKNHRIIVIENAGHLPFLTAKEQFYKHLRGFLNELE
jgi:pimeloyl-[acyl-carrier protein] methyl ester esterase